MGARFLSSIPKLPNHILFHEFLIGLYNIEVVKRFVGAICDESRIWSD